MAFTLNETCPSRDCLFPSDDLAAISPQSSSSLDPTFWPMHPTMERLWQFSVLTGTVKDMNWPDNDLSITLPDGVQYTQRVSSYYDTCEGHRGSDIFPYGLLDTDVDEFTVRTGIQGVGDSVPTNREVLEALSPLADSMSYIYDTFKWDHCAVDGYDFSDAWEDAPRTASVGLRLFEMDEPLSRLYTSFKREIVELQAGKEAGGS